MPSRKSKDGNYILYYSTDSGDANLTVGFYLEGPADLIKYLKKWDFGDGKQEKDHDIIKNHFYGRTSPQSCSGSVTVLDPVTEKPIISPIIFTINVNKHQTNPLYVSNFYQTEGVIFQDTAVGCSIDTQEITPNNIVWNWGDEKSTKGQLETNPWHSYHNVNKDTPVRCSVTVDGPKGNDVWNFDVMVLQDPRTVIGGAIDIEPSVWPHVNDQLIFLANLSPRQNPNDGYSYRYRWTFETNPSNTRFDGRGEEGVVDWNNLQKYTTRRSFDTSENYRVIFTIYSVVDGVNNPYLSISRSFNIRPKT